MGRFSRFLKDRDNFGHRVALNFNGQGDTVNTTVGGLLTIIMNTVIYSFLIMKMHVMITRGDNFVSKNEEFTNFEKLGVKKF
jgi:hypothetical protein